MSNNSDKAFEEMSQSFQHAYGYSSNGYYKASIPLYQKAIKEDKNSFASYNNMGVAKLYLAIEQKDKSLIEEAINDFKEAIRIVNEVYKYEGGYPFAEGNLQWAEQELKRLR